MAEHIQNGGAGLRPDERLPRSPWPSRMLVVLVPMHLAAFVLLYFGALRIVQNEILETHSNNALLLLREAIKDLHPFMVAEDDRNVGDRLDGFVAMHTPVELRLFDKTSAEIGRTDPPNTEVAEFLDSDRQDRFEFDREGREVLLNAMIRIESTQTCSSCHGVGETLGAATIRLDLTPLMSLTNRRLGGGLAGLLVAWTILVGVFNAGVTRAARNKIARLRRGSSAAGVDSAGGGLGVTELMLDPVSAELYASLRDVLKEQRDREQDIASRLQHTERLALLGRVSAGLAHEIKNPLAGIHGALELLQDEVIEERHKDLFRQMLHELDRVTQTIHSLLRYARPAAPNRTPTDISQLLNDSVALLRPGLHRRGISVDISVAPNLAPFPMDRDQIRQVIVNIVSNAADAIEEGGGMITVRASPLPGDGGVLIAITDSGVGIPEESVEAVFEPFYTTKFSGTGLGLATSRGFVQNHGGRIAVESEPGRGSTFYIVFPGNGRPSNGIDTQRGE